MEENRKTITIVAGDFNAKVYDRPQGEENTIGNNIYLKIDNMNEKTRDNRSRFVEFCVANEMVPINTWHSKRHAETLTYKPPFAKHFNDEHTARNFSQIDYIPHTKKMEKCVHRYRSK